MSKPISLSTWFEHMEHLQNGLEHSHRCGVCCLTATHEKHVPVGCREDVEFHNRAMKAKA
jgi:hypothetical protein